MDRKRFTGPKSSLPISNYLKNQSKTTGDVPERLLFIKSGLLSQSSGSAYLELGNIKVMAAVHGPRQISKMDSFSESGKLHCEFKFATFAFRDNRRQFVRDSEEKEFSTFLLNAISPAVRLELYPKATIDIFVNVMESDGLGASLAVAINCVSLALVDAGIQLFDLVSASSASFINNQISVNPTADQEEKQSGSILLSIMPSINEISNIVESGTSDSSLIVKSIEKTMEAAAVSYQAMTSSLVSGITKKKNKQK